MARRFYITTPIYYANDRPHIGHAYSTLLADVLARYHRLLGFEVYFLTGTDEHGQKVEQAAAKRGVTPQEQVDLYHLRFKELWEKLEIRYDHFIRTTDPAHKQFVCDSMQELYEKGEIYEKEYAGWYSVGEERFFADDELVDGRDPVSGNPVDWLTEKNYFFRMGKYQKQLIDHINSNPDFIQPDFRRNEVLGFLRNELQDLCISRPKARLQWGIPLPFDSDFVTYVWFDALLNYQSAVQNVRFSDGEAAWPADYHIIGKDILTTHAVYWPTMLMALGRPLPRHILAHGWWLSGGKKQSKSAGNVVDPLEYIALHGTDTVRYFLMREMVLGQDASFTDELFTTRVNADLANDLGNAINRVNKFIHSRFGGVMPPPAHAGDGISGGAPELELKTLAEAVRETFVEQILKLRLSFALEEVSRLVRAVNRYLEHRAPWKMDKGPEANRALLGTVLWSAAEALRLALSMLFPVMPERALTGLAMLGFSREPFLDDLRWGVLAGAETVAAGSGLFPRIEKKPSDDTGAMATETTRGVADNTSEMKEPSASADAVRAGSEARGKTPSPAAHPATALEFRVAEVVSAEAHPDADALFVLRLSVGGAERTVCAGIRKTYSAEELVGKRVVLFANLKPAKLRGIESAGMLLAADSGNGPRLVDPGTIPPGSLLRFGDLEPAPKAKATLKDFERVPLVVRAGIVQHADLPLQFGSTHIKTEAPDGTIVR